MIISVIAFIHLMTGTDKQHIAAFLHAKTSVLKRINRICPVYTQCTFALPFLIIFYNAHNLNIVALFRIPLSKYKEVIIFSFKKSTEFR